MIVYAIGDLHLPGGDDKPMAVFGAHWEGHWEKICQDWRARVTTQDVVLIPGDISWAMQLEHALDDLHAIAALPGRKILLRGNHDYWWSSLTRVREALPEGHVRPVSPRRDHAGGYYFLRFARVDMPAERGRYRE